MVVGVGAGKGREMRRKWEIWALRAIQRRFNKVSKWAGDAAHRRCIDRNIVVPHIEGQISEMIAFYQQELGTTPTDIKWEEFNVSDSVKINHENLAETAGRVYHTFYECFYCSLPDQKRMMYVFCGGADKMCQSELSRQI